MINATNLPQTCGQCHIGAGANFAQGKIHLSSELTSAGGGTDSGVIGTRVVRWIYLPLIVLTIGGMAVHNLLVWGRKVKSKRQAARNIIRLTFNQRLQHWLLLSSFIVLVLTGFALQYPESWLAWALGSEYLRRIIHRIAAVIMLVAGVYHLFYLARFKEGRSWVKDMMPGWKDVKDLMGNFAFYSGFSKIKPKIARFGYAEKAEYWAVVWGTIVMGLTGLMIWFKLGVFRFLPRWVIDIALAIHFYEAVLATLAIIVWHFYHVIFDPDVYPVNFAFIDGRMSEETYREEHELAYEQLKSSSNQESNESQSEGDKGDV
jgi:formate dehydrogenase gamma subunit